MARYQVSAVFAKCQVVSHSPISPANSVLRSQTDCTVSIIQNPTASAHTPLPVFPEETLQQSSKPPHYSKCRATNQEFLWRDLHPNHDSNRSGSLQIQISFPCDPARKHLASQNSTFLIPTRTKNEFNFFMHNGL